MKGLPEERAVIFAEYMIQNNATVRAAAAAFGISKSTVHKDLVTRLRRQNPALWAQVKAILAKNKAERHLRGGAATKAKYCKPNASNASTTPNRNTAPNLGKTDAAKQPPKK